MSQPAVALTPLPFELVYDDGERQSSLACEPCLTGVLSKDVCKV